ncbi:hypothetical protein BCV70DRAFT_16162 [Testicularia cyperi]|uniref:Uncharacterized protein n=1 Tax=Testicularia cyperi TaxID=1882483 RepID=A0A317XZ40_9BASI|nr:hypothetical protein BCV70DRAFT_16162 [Testicularia cyperi]
MARPLWVRLPFRAVAIPVPESSHIPQLNSLCSPVCRFPHSSSALVCLFTRPNRTHARAPWPNTAHAHARPLARPPVRPPPPLPFPPSLCPS